LEKEEAIRRIPAYSGGKTYFYSSFLAQQGMRNRSKVSLPTFFAKKVG